mmetsp:Transcript_35304/g.63491  ORF Transcript_35304/g.63491 Transcript_35304/m.63491 type:complete len:127 (-) Transcript_35304:48-428(-)
MTILKLAVFFEVLTCCAGDLVIDTPCTSDADCTQDFGTAGICGTDDKCTHRECSVAGGTCSSERGQCDAGKVEDSTGHCTPTGFVCCKAQSVPASTAVPKLASIDTLCLTLCIAGAMALARIAKHT